MSDSYNGRISYSKELLEKVLPGTSQIIRYSIYDILALKDSVKIPTDLAYLRALLTKRTEKVLEEQKDRKRNNNNRNGPQDGRKAGNNGNSNSKNKWRQQQEADEVMPEWYVDDALGSKDMEAFGSGSMESLQSVGPLEDFNFEAANKAFNLEDFRREMKRMENGEPEQFEQEVEEYPESSKVSRFGFVSKQEKEVSSRFNFVSAPPGFSNVQANVQPQPSNFEIDEEEEEEDTNVSSRFFGAKRKEPVKKEPVKVVSQEVPQVDILALLNASAQKSMTSPPPNPNIPLNVLRRMSSGKSGELPSGNGSNHFENQALTSGPTPPLNQHGGQFLPSSAPASNQISPAMQMFMSQQNMEQFHPQYAPNQMMPPRGVSPNEFPSFNNTQQLPLMRPDLSAQQISLIHQQQQQQQQREMALRHAATQQLLMNMMPARPDMRPPTTQFQGQPSHAHGSQQPQNISMANRVSNNQSMPQVSIPSPAKTAEKEHAAAILKSLLLKKDPEPAQTSSTSYNTQDQHFYQPRNDGTKNDNNSSRNGSARSKNGKGKREKK